MMAPLEPLLDIGEIGEKAAASSSPASRLS